MHGNRIRPSLAAWNRPGPVTAAELDQLDGALARSINGDDGGVWAPAAAIEIGGAGVKMWGTLQATGLVQVNSSSGTYLSGTGGLHVNTPAIFTDALLVDSLEASGDVDVGADLSVDGIYTLQGASHFFDDMHLHQGEFIVDVLATLTVDGTLEANGEARFNGTTDFYGDVTFGNSSSDDLLVKATAEFDAAVEFAGATTFDGDARFNAHLECYGPSIVFHSGVNFRTLGSCTFGDTATDTIDCIGQMHIHAPVQFNDTGRIPEQPILGANTNRSYKATDANFIYFAEGSLTAARHYGIDDTGAVDGDSITFVNADSNHAIGVSLPAGTSSDDVTTVKAFNEVTPGVVRVVRKAGRWGFADCFDASRLY